MKRRYFVFGSLGALILAFANLSAFADATSPIPQLSGENLGVYGQIYPIAEPDMLTYIHERLEELQKNGQLQKMERDFSNRVVEHTLRPTPVAGIGTTTQNSTFYYTPSFTLPNNIYDANGKLIYSAGTTINPLDPASLQKINPNLALPVFNEILFFINADDKTQVDWVKGELAQNNALKNPLPIKIILTRGNIKSAGDALGRIYFDQNGVLCQKLGIRTVPAKVVRVGSQLQIQEISLLQQEPKATTVVNSHAGEGG